MSIAPLPNEDGQACCPTTIDAWAGEGFEQSWALYVVPDGFIAATSVQGNGEGPPDDVVTRHRGAGYSRRRNPFPTAAAAELPSCRAAELPSCGH